MKVLKYSSIVFVFSVSLIILINNFRIQSADELSSAEKYLKHLSADHKINDLKYGFIKINFIPNNYFEKGADTEIIVSLNSLFLIPLNVIIYQYSARKNFSAEKLFLNTCFKDLHLQPPKCFS